MAADANLNAASVCESVSRWTGGLLMTLVALPVAYLDRELNRGLNAFIDLIERVHPFEDI